MLFRHPDLVHPEKSELSRGTYIDSRLVPRDHFAPGDRVMWITTWHDQIRVTPKGHHGYPRAASAVKGKALWEAVVSNGVEFIEAMRKFTGAHTD